MKKLLSLAAALVGMAVLAAAGQAGCLPDQDAGYVKVHFHRTPGVGDFSSHPALDLDSKNLSAEEAKQLRKMIEDANFFDLKSNPPQSPVVPDPLAGYDLTVDMDGRTHAVWMVDSAVGESLKPLIDWLTLKVRAWGELQRPHVALKAVEEIKGKLTYTDGIAIEQTPDGMDGYIAADGMTYPMDFSVNGLSGLAKKLDGKTVVVMGSHENRSNFYGKLTPVLVVASVKAVEDEKQPAIHVEFTKSGGLAGLHFPTTTIDGTTLSAKDAQKLAQLIAEVRFYGQPERYPIHGADLFEYTIIVELNGKRHSVSYDDEPAELKPLIDWLSSRPVTDVPIGCVIPL